MLWLPALQGGFELAGQLSTIITVTVLLLDVFWTAKQTPQAFPPRNPGPSPRWCLN